MKRFTALLAVAIGLSLPAVAQDRYENGRHIGPYGGGGNPYQQRGGGIAPVFRTDDGRQPYQIMPQKPRPLPVVPNWTTAQPDTGHSLQYQQYEQTLQQQQPTTPQPVAPQQGSTYNLPPVAPAQPDLRATAVSTLNEIEQILDYQPTISNHVDYLSWYLNGAHVDPAQFLRAGAEWPETAFRQFMADYLVSFWNVTMQDSILRILMPLILVAMILKVASMLIDKLLRAKPLEGY